MFQKKYIGSFQPEADPPSAEISRFLSEARCQTVPGEAKGSYFRNICLPYRNQGSWAKRRVLIILRTPSF